MKGGIRMMIFIKLLRLLFTLLFKTKIEGLHHIDFSRKTILMPNHVSLLDAIILSLYLPRNVTFVANTKIAAQYSFILRFRKHITIDPLNPYSMRQMMRKVNEGWPILIFPEGRITRTGGLMKIYSGVGYLALKTGADLYPIIINGLERSTFSYLTSMHKTRWFPKVKISIAKPFTIPLDPTLSIKAQKEKASDMILHTLQEQLFYSRSEQQVNLFNKVIESAQLNGMKFPICEDLSQEIHYRKLLLGSYLLGHKIKNLVSTEDRVGILLPNSIGHVVTLLSFFYIGKSPAILNFSQGTQTIAECCETAQIKTILTSRLFVEKGKLEELIDFLSTQYRVIYLEDIKDQINFSEKLYGLILCAVKKKSQATENELILFTSGSESKPKGVVLTHENLFHNIQQVRSVIDFTSKDKILNVLPMFHSFGLTAGTLLPVLCGVPVYLYPTPLHYKVIPEIVYDRSATVLFGTSTFLGSYGKFAHPYDFQSLRYVFAGAEKLRSEVRDLWLHKFGLRIMEGYGATETSPILSLNTPLQYRQGTVGRFLPGISYKVEKVEGVTMGGKLLVQGPNIMKGYLLYKQGFTPAESWYDTGDVVDLDSEGFLSIKSRVKRFAKIGGEMISLNQVEEIASQCFQSTHFAAINLPDQRKGEKIILFTTDTEATLPQLREWLDENGYSPLLLPRKMELIDKIPLLGSGKTDYVTLKNNYLEESIS